VFERYRRALASTAFPPVLQAQFHLQTAESYEALALPDAAVAAAGRARVVAERYGFNSVAFSADELTARVRASGAAGSRTPDAPIPESLKTIATTLGEMRRLIPG
jgi:hypothetical protein